MEAPYEVGGQLSFLAAQNHVDAVITTTDNDTVADLLAYGCPVIITNMDQDGTATKIAFQDTTFSSDINLTGWDVKAIHSLYLLSGACKQLPTLPNMDTHVAHKLLSHHNHNIHSVGSHGTCQVLQTTHLPLYYRHFFILNIIKFLYRADTSRHLSDF